LPLARYFDNRRFTLHAPGLAMDCIGTKPRFIPEINAGLRFLGFQRNICRS
jgi:hypothetical protein